MLRVSDPERAQWGRATFVGLGPTAAGRYPETCLRSALTLPTNILKYICGAFVDCKLGDVDARCNASYDIFKYRLMQFYLQL